MKRALKILIILLIPISLMSLRDVTISVANVPLSVIVNTPNAPSGVNMMELKTLLRGEKQRWEDGTKISLAFMKTSTDVGSNMSTRIFGMTAKELNKFFLAKVFQGKMTAPEFFDTESDLLDYVKTTKGTISVINEKSSTGFKTIKIDGQQSF